MMKLLQCSAGPPLPVLAAEVSHSECRRPASVSIRLPLSAVVLSAAALRWLTALSSPSMSMELAMALLVALLVAALVVAYLPADR